MWQGHLWYVQFIVELFVDLFFCSSCYLVILFWAVHLQFFNDVFKTIFSAFTFALKYTVYTYKNFPSYTVSMIPSHIHIIRSGSLAYSLEAT